MPSVLLLVKGLRAKKPLSLKRVFYLVLAKAIAREPQLYLLDELLTILVTILDPVSRLLCEVS
jgi:ABC-type phosphate transport system ATPase subunit